MAARLTNSEKNARERAKYIEKLAKQGASDASAVQQEMDRMRGAWKAGTAAKAADTYEGDRQAPTSVFRPKKGGGGTYVGADGTELEISKTEAKLAKDSGGDIGDLIDAATGGGQPKPESVGDAAGAAGKQIGEAFRSGDGIDQANSLIQGGGRVLGAAAPWLVEDMGASEAPQNVGQWLINALSTGTYVTARAAEGAGAAFDKARKEGVEMAAKGDLGGAIARQGQGLLEANVNWTGGAARGLAEGLAPLVSLGAWSGRFDGERPRTWGQNLEALGTEDALKDALGEKAGTFTQGIIGTAADIGLDPLTYATLGGAGAVRGALKGAAEGAATGTTAAGKVARGTQGAFRGAAEGAAARRAELAAQRASAAEARQVRRAAARGEDIAGAPDLLDELQPQLALPAGRVAEASVPEPEAAAAQRLFVAGDEVFQPGELDLRSDQLALPAAASDYRPRAGSVEEVQAAARLQNPVLRETDELLPGLSREVTPQVDAAGILGRARTAKTTRRPLIDEAGSAKLADVLARGRNAIEQDGAAPERVVAGALQQLERDPQIAPVLERVGADDGSTVRELVEAALRGHRGSMNAVGKLWRREVDDTATGVSTATLREAVDALLPGARVALGVEGNRLHKLVSRISRTADPTKQEDILRSVLGRSYKEGFGTFRDALAAAGRGELDVLSMQKMAAALGLRTRATTPAGLSKLLRGQGVKTYDEAVAQIPSAEEVNRVFNISPRVQAEMAQVDPEAELADAAAMLDEQAAALPGAEGIQAEEIPATELGAPTAHVKAPKPPVRPARRPADFTARDVERVPGDRDTLNQPGKAAYAGVRELGRLLREAAEGKATGNTLTSYTDEVSTAVHRAVVNQLKLSYLKRGGADRAERFLPRYLEVMNVVESYARSKGTFPHLVDSANGTGDIWVSSTQALELLPEEVLQRAMFAPKKTRGSLAAEKAIGFANGFTLYPNHVMSGLKAALAGGDPAMVAKIITDRAVGASRGMQRGTDKYVKAYAETKAGKAAIDDLAAALTEPGYLDAIRELDARVKPVAEAIAQRHIDDVTERAGAALIRTVQEGGDRGTLLKVIDEVDRWAADAARPALLDADRIQASVTERLNSAIVKGILGEEGFLVAQHDWKFATAIDDSTPAQIQARQAQMLAEDLGRRPVTRPTDGGVTMRPAQQRAAYAQVAEREVVDLEQTARAEVGAKIEAETGIPREQWDEQLFAEEDWQTSAKLIDGLFSRTSGKWGQEDLWARRTSAEEGAITESARYSNLMRNWIGLTAKRLGVKPAEALDRLNGPIWHALANTDPANWGNRGLLALELSAGRRLPAEGVEGIPLRPFSALDETDVQLALELHRFLDHVWNPEQTGLAGRAGVTAADVADASKWYLRGADAQFAVDPGRALRDQAMRWRAWGGVADSPLDVLDRTQQAINAASVPARIGQSLAPLFGNRALRPGVSNAQLYREGWRRLDTDNAAGVARFVDPNAYFPPEILAQLKHLDRFLESSRGFDPESAFGKLVINPFDKLMHVWKSANTIWRPGHHVTNVLGELGMLIMAGVNPAGVGRAMKAIKAGGGAVDADLSALDDMVRSIADPKAAARRSTRRRELDEKFAGDSAKIVLRDGRGGHQIEEIPLSQVWEWAVNSGVALTHTSARDLTENLGSGIAPSFLRDNPLARADEGLGKFSAVRDNVTRLTHFIHGLEKGTYANLDQARAAAEKLVHDYHPTVRTLSRWEQKYARRMFGFYTWMRQAVSRVIRTALDQPGYATMPFKLQYNLAEAQGLNPESIGGPTSDDPRLRSYTTRSLLGPTLLDQDVEWLGLAPDQDDAVLDDLWSASLSSPQIDTLNTLFGSFNVDPTKSAQQNAEGLVMGGIELGADTANPLISVPLKAYAESQKYGGAGKGPLQLAAESGGLPTALARAIPSGNGEGGSVFSEIFPNSTEAKRTPEEQASGMQRYLLNLTTGLKFQNTTGGTAEAGAKREFREQVKRRLAERGVTDADAVSEIANELWEMRMTENLRG